MPAGEMNLDPDVVRAGGRELAATAAAALDFLQGQHDQIRALEGDRPWGNDDAGAAFEPQYEPSDAAAVQAVTLPVTIAQFADAIVVAADRSQAVDEEGAGDILSLGAGADLGPQVLPETR